MTATTAASSSTENAGPVSVMMPGNDEGDEGADHVNTSPWAKLMS